MTIRLTFKLKQMYISMPRNVCKWTQTVPKYPPARGIVKERPLALTEEALVMVLKDKNTKQG